MSMKPEIMENSVVRKLIRLKNKRCPESSRWHIHVTVWDDGDYEMRLRTSWGDTFTDFYYRYSMNKYFCHVENFDKYESMEELK